LYRDWSDFIHAGSSLRNVGRKQDGTTVLRPLRHPEGLQGSVRIASGICLAISQRLVDVYAKEEKDEFKNLYVQNIQARLLEVSGKELIHAPWQ
jgi:hypothetical protein